MAKAHAARFDRRKFLKLVDDYGHAEFMLGVEGAGPTWDVRSKAARDSAAALRDYIESVVDCAALKQVAGEVDNG